MLTASRFSFVVASPVNCEEDNGGGRESNQGPIEPLSQTASPLLSLRVAILYIATNSVWYASARHNIATVPDLTLRGSVGEASCDSVSSHVTCSHRL